MTSRSNALSAPASLARDMTGIGTDSAVVRLLRDMALCAGGTVLGARIDGPLAYLTMQSICGGDSFSLWSTVSVHLELLPATSAIMALIAMTCQWPGRSRKNGDVRITAREAAWRWPSFALRTTLMFLAMMLAMGLTQAPFRQFLPASPSSAILAAVTGMLLLAVVSAALRPLALRVPFLLPLCCR